MGIGYGIITINTLFSGIVSDHENLLTSNFNLNLLADFDGWSVYNISKTALDELKKRFTNVYILFDNDEAGLKDGKELAQKTGLINLVLPEFKGGKDVSDLYKVEGKDRLTDIINNLLQEN